MPTNIDTTMYNKGLIVGKFSPLHRGHEFLVRKAKQRCRELIIISYSKPEFERCDRLHRQQWLSMVFPDQLCLAIDDSWLATRCQQLGIAPCDIPNIPDNAAPDNDHRIFVGWLCLKLLRTTVDVVFTSEDYGVGFAQVLTNYFQTAQPGCKVTHHCVDLNRKAFPISATQIRNSPVALDNFIAPIVHASFVKRLCILGGESSGKTSLAAALAAQLDRQLNTQDGIQHGPQWVPEYGRTLWETRDGELYYSDMLQIARQQIIAEARLATSVQNWLVCDTSPLTTLFYSQVMFQQVDPQLALLAERPYDLVVLCDPAIDFIQDGTRRDSKFREQQHQWYLQTLQAQGIPFVLVSGSVEERCERVLALIL